MGRDHAFAQAGPDDGHREAGEQQAESGEAHGPHDRHEAVVAEVAGIGPHQARGPAQQGQDRHGVGDPRSPSRCRRRSGGAGVTVAATTLGVTSGSRTAVRVGDRSRRRRRGGGRGQGGGDTEDVAHQPHPVGGVRRGLGQVGGDVVQPREEDEGRARSRSRLGPDARTASSSSVQGRWSRARTASPNSRVWTAARVVMTRVARSSSGSRSARAPSQSTMPVTASPVTRRFPGVMSPWDQATVTGRSASARCSAAASSARPGSASGQARATTVTGSSIQLARRASGATTVWAVGPCRPARAADALRRNRSGANPSPRTSSAGRPGTAVSRVQAWVPSVPWAIGRGTCTAPVGQDRLLGQHLHGDELLAAGGLGLVAAGELEDPGCLRRAHPGHHQVGGGVQDGPVTQVGQGVVVEGGDGPSGVAALAGLGPAPTGCAEGPDESGRQGADPEVAQAGGEEDGATPLWVAEPGHAGAGHAEDGNQQRGPGDHGDAEDGVQADDGPHVPAGPLDADVDAGDHVGDGRQRPGAAGGWVPSVA